MAFEPVVWYCQPVANGVWQKQVDGAFGEYTPCAIDSLVFSISNLVLLGLCFYRIWLIKNNTKAQRFNLRSNSYNYMLALLAGYCTAEPLFRLVMGISLFNLNGENGLAPFEIASLIIEAFAWCSMLIMIGLEIKIYIWEFRWYVRFGVFYVLVGDAVLLNLILPLKDYCSRSAFYLYVSTVFCQVLFGILLLVYVPHLDPYLGYNMMLAEPLEHIQYEALAGGEQICPERNVSVFSRIYFGWITPLMQLGYRKPITEKDVWKLDTWDQTETLIEKFQRSWAEESKKSKPLLLRALNNSLGGRFWLGGLFKICYDLSQFVGPIVLNHLLQSMQRGDPAWTGYTYAFLIFAGVMSIIVLSSSYAGSSNQIKLLNLYQI